MYKSIYIAIHHIATSDTAVSTNVGTRLRPGVQDKDVCHFKITKNEICIPFA